MFLTYFIQNVRLKQMSDEKCPPSKIDISIEKGSIIAADSKNDTLTNKIEGKGLSNVVLRSIDRGNTIADLASTEKTSFYLTAIRELGIKCDDLFDEFFEIEKQRNALESQLEFFKDDIAKAMAKLRENDSPIGVTFNMSEMHEWKHEIRKQIMRLNAKVIDRFIEGLTEIYDKDASQLTKLLVEGKI